MRMNIRTTGASFVGVSAIETNPRDLVLTLITNNPTSTRAELFPKFREILSKGPDGYQRAVDYYFFANMFGQITDARPMGHPRGPVPSPQSTAQALEVEQILVDRVKAQFVLLDLTMTNGKLLRDCTFQEVATFSNRFAKLATKGKKAELVGVVLTEDQVKAIMK